jgi:hypothetical protein
MWYQYRPIEKGEFLLAGGDCSQGGNDYNACQFFSKTRLDVPLVYHSRGVAADMTEAVYPVLERIFDVTGLPPVVAFERQNGGASEMRRLEVLNRLRKYTIFVMPKIGDSRPGNDTEEETDSLGWNTSTLTRPLLVGTLKQVVDGKVIRIYHAPTIGELNSFVKNRFGKPEAARGSHDDLLIALGVSLQLHQYCDVPVVPQSHQQPPPWYNPNRSFNNPSMMRRGR